MKVAKTFGVAFDLHSVFRLIGQCADLKLKDPNDTGGENDCVKTSCQSKKRNLEEQGPILSCIALLKECCLK